MGVMLANSEPTLATAAATMMRPPPIAHHHSHTTPLPCSQYSCSLIIISLTVTATLLLFVERMERACVVWQGKVVFLCVAAGWTDTHLRHQPPNTAPPTSHRQLTNTPQVYPLYLINRYSYNVPICGNRKSMHWLSRNVSFLTLISCIWWVICVAENSTVRVSGTAVASTPPHHQPVITPQVHPL